MKTIKLSSAKWREVALEYKPKTNFDNVMHDVYGLKRVILQDDIFGHYYKVLDEQKYLMFVLRWA